MNKNEIQKMVSLRSHIIEYYNKLEGRGTNIAVTNTKDVAIFCEDVVKSLDHILSDYVSFQKEKK